MKRRFLSIFVLLVSANWVCAAAIVGTEHMRDAFGNTFTIDENFASTDNTGFSFFHSGETSFGYSGDFLDDGVSLFIVEADVRFSEGSIIGGEFIELKVGNLYSLPMNFFLGTRTPNIASEGGYPLAYGWAEFENNGSGELVLLDHAIAYGSQGIEVNTTNAIPIPEPDSFLLIVGSILFLVKVRFREPCLFRSKSNV